MKRVCTKPCNVLAAKEGGGVKTKAGKIKAAKGEEKSKSEVKTEIIQSGDPAPGSRVATKKASSPAKLFAADPERTDVVKEEGKSKLTQLADKNGEWQKNGE